MIDNEEGHRITRMNPNFILIIFGIDPMFQIYSQDSQT